MRAILATALLCLCIAGSAALAREDGRFADDPALHAWFDHLASGKGLCCSFADGRSVADVDWGTHDGHYWVIIDGLRYAVPAEAIVIEPNKFGAAMVWPYLDGNGNTQIRCFMPGSGA